MFITQMMLLASTYGLALVFIFAILIIITILENLFVKSKR
jgi:hypothetical protein